MQNKKSTNFFLSTGFIFGIAFLFSEVIFVVPVGLFNLSFGFVTPRSFVFVAFKSSTHVSSLITLLIHVSSLIILLTWMLLVNISFSSS
ncbi:hypothetical protein NBO_396g0005 [Nosema bombycis CQ1]|uniref:Uncharacterized protein n=1 Tax=Nosema bombycis (strain CQ1 / CVCC 102059) TaxID=578461 RepID=R0KPI4_NOSB1|nr:hypothetical protein NBO_396g0005 [Nosema bombycis CQ1]|eukprot:EOB12616.1 hypothetical protein NBO_396g0005 [Nosema bombycis CQ1]